MMLSKKWVINILLAFFFVFFGIKTCCVWFEDEEPDIKVAAAKKSARRTVKKKILKKNVPSESAYTDIADLDLFSPDRKEYIPKEPETETVVKEIKKSGKRIILYGVIIADDYKSALIDDPAAKRGQRKSKWVKEGETIQGLKLAAIEEDRIFLTEGADRYEIFLYDANKPKTREHIAKETTPKVVVTKPKPKKKKTKPAVSMKKETQEGEYEIISTPFGKVKRRKK